MKKLSRPIFAYLIFLSITCSITINAAAQPHILFGTTSAGGDYSMGTVFGFNTNNGGQGVLHSFNGAEGSAPKGTLVYDSLRGVFYGMTSGSGLYDGGTLYSFNPETDSLKVLWNFGSDSDGTHPSAEVVYFAGTGLYYGTTYEGGNQGGGTIFTFNPLDNSEKVVWNFGNDNDGSNPNGDLIYDTATRLFYATTQYGGVISSYGTIIRFDPIVDTECVVWRFGKGTDGVYPMQNLSYGPDGHFLYGTTYAGGKDGVEANGTIYRFNPANDSEIVLWNFLFGTGDNPQSGMVYNSNDGLFYGVTGNGGAAFIGVIYSFNPTTDSEIVVWNFAGYPTDGAYPQASMLYYPAEQLYYGTSTAGRSGGTIYSFNPADNSEELVYGLLQQDTGHVGSYSPLVLYTGVSTAVTTMPGTPSVCVYPNPSEGVFTLSGLSIGQTIEVDNYLGQKISTLAAQQPVQQLNIGYVPDGIYLLRILTAEGTPVYNTKVVKN